MKWLRFDEILQGLLDWDFKKLVTPSIIRVLYIIGWVLALVSTVNYIARGFAVNQVYGILATLLSGLVFAFFVLILRVVLEILMAFFKSATSNSPEIVEKPKIIETVESAVPTKE